MKIGNINEMPWYYRLAVFGAVALATYGGFWYFMTKGMHEEVDTLKQEVASLSQTHGEQAQSIAGFTELSAHEATRTSQNPDLLRLSLQGLNSSVEGFEQSHPKLVQTVNNISSTLANLGI